MPGQIPRGTATFLFTDIEGSTRMWETAPATMGPALARHNELLHQAVQKHHGYVFKTVGDAFCCAFARAGEAVAAALDAQLALAAEGWPPEAKISVRMGIHTGEAEEREGDYFGQPLNRVARIMSTAHGGQVLISTSTQSVVLASLPPEASLVDLGVHRLKDLQLSERLYQLVHPKLPREFPPLRSLNVVTHNLPVHMTSFVGREREIGELRDILQNSRLITITGAGGAGKTRLASQLAAEVAPRFPDGVFFVDLAPLADEHLAVQAAATAVGVREEPGKPLLETLKQDLRDKRALILLDNCEHLVRAAADLVEAIVRACPGVVMVATSREQLGVHGETTYRAPSLGLPPAKGPYTAETLMQHEAVKLFMDRVLAAQPRFQLTDQNAPAIAQIVIRLDGIPLAIELAAARVRAMSVEQIAQRLNDAFRLLTGGNRSLPRHQTLRAAIEWSYTLLSPQEKLLLQRLSVFAGGFTLEAAEKVCSDDVEPVSELH